MSQNDVTITVGAKDNASPVVDSATKNILSQWKVMRQEVRATTAEFQLQNQTLVSASNAFRAVGSIAGSAMNIFTQFNTMQIRITDANNSLILAQLHYNQVLAEQGPGTNDAIAASIQLQEAKQNVAQATQQETLGYIGMAFELGSTVSLMISSVPKIQEFIKQMQNARTEAQLTNALSTASGGGVGTGVIGGGGGKLGKALGLAGGVGLVAGGVMTGGEDKDMTTKLLSVGESAGGGALTGATLGSIVPGLGTAIGAVAGGVIGAGIGIYQNFHDEIANFLSGKGSGSSNSGQVEHVVTIKIQNDTDHKVSATESSMGIEQVMSPSQ